MRKLRYKVGRALQKIGIWLGWLPDRIERFGMDMWIDNCDCLLCRRRGLK